MTLKEEKPRRDGTLQDQLRLMRGLLVPRESRLGCWPNRSSTQILNGEENGLRGAVTIVLQDVLRVRMVYVAIYLNIDYASG